MKTIHVALILLVGLLTTSTNCQNDNEVTTTVHSDRIKINYDFENLRLFLNSTVTETKSRIDWKWDHMNSRNGSPDTTSIEYFETRDQPYFKFDDQVTLPALSIVTDKNKIIEFYAATIFTLAKHDKETIIAVIDSLNSYDLLNQTEVQQAILETSRYYRETENFEEELRLDLAEEEYEYSRMSYEIKIKK